MIVVCIIKSDWTNGKQANGHTLMIGTYVKPPLPEYPRTVRLEWGNIGTYAKQTQQTG